MNLTTRDHMAIESLKALILEPEWSAVAETLTYRIVYETGAAARVEGNAAMGYAHAAYVLADAMLDESERHRAPLAASVVAAARALVAADNVGAVAFDGAFSALVDAVAALDKAEA